MLKDKIKEVYDKYKDAQTAITDWKKEAARLKKLMRSMERIEKEETPDFSLDAYIKELDAPVVTEPEEK